MKFRHRLISFILILFLVTAAIPLAAEALPLAGITAVMVGESGSTLSSNSPLAGICLTLNYSLENAAGAAFDDEEDTEEEPEAEIPQIPEIPKIDYATTAVAKVNDFVNVRGAASEDAPIVGKLYKDCVGTVFGVDGDWTLIESRNVQGFVRSDFLTVGDKAQIDSVAKYKASVKADALKLRKGMSTESAVLDVARNGEKLDVTNDDMLQDGWIAIKRGTTEAFVACQYVDLSYEFSYAETKAEEEKRLAAEAARADSSAASRGSQVANYALRFVGNPYVWGGTSLTKGADCSGFIMSVYAHFGVSLPHSSAADRHVGRKVNANVNDMRPGDIVCYSGHVALYIGGGKIVHAASRRSGIKVSNAFYRKVLAVRRIF